MGILFTLLLTCLSSSSNADCSDFRTGTYSLKDAEVGTDHLIERTNTIQTETNLKTGTKSIFSVTWINDCEYELTIIEGRDEVMNYFKDKTLVVQITQTTENGYSFDSFIKGTDRVVSNYVTRVSP